MTQKYSIALQIDAIERYIVRRKKEIPRMAVGYGLEFRSKREAEIDLEIVQSVLDTLKQKKGAA